MILRQAGSGLDLEFGSGVGMGALPCEQSPDKDSGYWARLRVIGRTSGFLRRVTALDHAQLAERLIIHRLAGRNAGTIFRQFHQTIGPDQRG